MALVQVLPQVYTEKHKQHCDCTGLLVDRISTVLGDAAERVKEAVFPRCDPASCWVGISEVGGYFRTHGSKALQCTCRVIHDDALHCSTATVVMHDHMAPDATRTKYQQHMTRTQLRLGCPGMSLTTFGAASRPRPGTG